MLFWVSKALQTRTMLMFLLCCTWSYERPDTDCSSQARSCTAQQLKAGGHASNACTDEHMLSLGYNRHTDYGMKEL